MCLRLVGKLLLEVAGFTIVVVAYSLHGRCLLLLKHMSFILEGVVKLGKSAMQT